MTRFHIQMKKMRNDPKNYDNIWPNGDWTLQDYKDMCWCIERGYLVQDLSCCSMFMINQEWEGEDIYAEEFICSEEEEMKSIDWVKRNETMIDYTIDRSNEPDSEPESDTDDEE